MLGLFCSSLHEKAMGTLCCALIVVTLPPVIAGAGYLFRQKIEHLLVFIAVHHFKTGNALFVTVINSIWQVVASSELPKKYLEHFPNFQLLCQQVMLLKIE
jgi:hypothetical protein